MKYTQTPDRLGITCLQALLVSSMATGCIQDRPLAMNSGVVDSDGGISSNNAARMGNEDTPQPGSSSNDAQGIEALSPADASVPLLDGSTQDDAAAPVLPIDCVNVCDRVITCVGSRCENSPFGRFTSCVRACQDGTIDLADVIDSECVDITTWVCSGVYAETCDCENVLCEEGCEKAITCLADVCEEPIFSLEDCVSVCQEQPTSLPADSILDATCEEVQAGYCPSIFQFCEGCPQPEPDAFNLGAPCARSRECVTGRLSPYCIPEISPRNGEMTGWIGGYCIGLDCRGGDCGDQGLCLVLAEGGQTGCLARCDEDTPCRDGYMCTPVDESEPSVRLCLPM